MAKTTASVELCTLDDVRDWIKKTGGATEAPTDTFLGELIARVSLWFETKTNRSFLRGEHSGYYRGNGKQRLYLRQAPIAETQGSGLPEVTYWDGATWRDVTAELQLDLNDPGDVGELAARGGIFHQPADGIANYRIRITTGYGTSPASVPRDVRNAATIAVDLLLRYREIGLHAFSATSGAEGQSWTARGVSEQDADSLRMVDDVIGNYRLYNGTA